MVVTVWEAWGGVGLVKGRQAGEHMEGRCGWQAGWAQWPCHMADVRCEEQGQWLESDEAAGAGCK